MNTLDGNWHFVAFVVTGNSQNDISNSVMYADGVIESVYTTVKTAAPSPKTAVYLGKAYLNYFSGDLADVQIYNTSLDANQIQALYLKGIGAAPVDPNHIVGWWPLNGDAKDYSGNNNGAPTNIIFTGSWLSGYTTP